MKTKIFMTIAAAATLLTACDKNNEMETPWNGEIRLTTATTDMDVQSRAGQNLQSTQFASGEKISVFINENGGSSTTYTQPLEFTADGSGKLARPLSSQPYFPQSGNGVNIYACYPHGAADAVGTAKDFTIRVNQVDDLNYMASDLMLGLPASNPVARTSSEVKLTFTHQLSKINIELVAGAGLQASDLDGAMVALKGIKSTISFDPKIGITGDAKGNVLEVAVMTAATATLTGSAIIIPQTIAKDAAFIEVKLKSGGLLTYKLATATTFAPQTQYSYRITVKLTELTVSSEITPWTAVGQTPVVGDATM